MQEYRANRAFFLFALIFVVLAWIVIAYIALTGAMPYNSSSTRFYNSEYLFLSKILPEGFSFFTRDPREPQVILYSKTLKQPIEFHNSSPIYFFGLNRYQRAANLELSVIWETVKGQEWYNCSSGGVECFDDKTTPHYSITNFFPDPMLVGEYYIKVIEPTPWAWANSFKLSGKSMPCKTVWVSIHSNL